MLDGRRVLLVITGGVAAYKCLELIRRLYEQGARVRCILTEAATHLVAPLTVAAVSGERVFTDLFSLTDEAKIGHIRLVRDADLVVVAPATADILAKMATGIADDLASTALLAADVPILVAPAMNPVMWAHPATRANAEVLRSRGVRFVGPACGGTACGEEGEGRMVEAAEILDAVRGLLAPEQPLRGRRALVTSGPTHEPIDPVRIIANRSSGTQGHAVAAAFARAGAEVTLVSGPVRIDDPAGAETVHVTTAEEMAAAVREHLPVDVAVCVAAVSDWRVAEPASHKLKKDGGPPRLELIENPDILAELSAPGPRRPRLVVGFAAETENVVGNARVKLERKGCDWIVANDIGLTGELFGSDTNTVWLISGEAVDSWPTASKDQVAQRLVAAIAAALDTN